MFSVEIFLVFWQIFCMKVNCPFYFYESRDGFCHVDDYLIYFPINPDFWHLRRLLTFRKRGNSPQNIVHHFFLSAKKGFLSKLELLLNNLLAFSIFSLSQSQLLFLREIVTITNNFWRSFVSPPANLLQSFHNSGSPLCAFSSMFSSISIILFWISSCIHSIAAANSKLCYRNMTINDHKV